MKEEFFNYLKDVPPELAFRTDHGNLNSLNDLLAEITLRGDAFFNTYVTKEKNDFAAWIRTVIGDKGLARSLLATRSREKAQQLIYRRIVYLDYFKQFDTIQTQFDDIYMIHPVHAVDYQPSMHFEDTLNTAEMADILERIPPKPSRLKSKLVLSLPGMDPIKTFFTSVKARFFTK